jgi:hypothetical protein
MIVHRHRVRRHAVHLGLTPLRIDARTHGLLLSINAGVSSLPASQDAFASKACSDGVRPIVH